MLKYEWIYSQLLTQIQTGSLQAGAKLPSIRQLSQQFSCSKYFHYFRCPTISILAKYNALSKWSLNDLSGTT